MATLNQAKIIKSLEKITEDLDKKTFFFDFLKAYGFPKTTIQRLEKNDPSRNIALEPGDYGLTKQIYFHLVRHGNLSKALNKLIKNDELKNQRIRFFIVTDFQDLMAYDARVDDYITVDINDLSSNYDFFLPLTNQYEKPLAYSEHPADEKACEKMGRLYRVIRLLNHYKDKEIHNLNVFLARLIFCFFAEDTGIFPKKGQMTTAIESMTTRDGKDLSLFFEQLFEILDIPEKSKKRNTYPATLQAFPYVNGGLFRERTKVPNFNAKGRNLLLECGRLEWKDISPAIFGSMFQSVIDPEERHAFGAHYTSEKNILKLINPLFLDDLREELENLIADKSKRRIKKLKEFQKKLAGLKFLDPACGCGNFLIITYREIKKLELRAAQIIYSKESLDRSLFDDWREKISRVSIQQFYGIEIEEFPAEIARVSMWLMEHVLNTEFSKSFGQLFPSIPLSDSATIVTANALKTSWDSVVQMDDLNYILGNPPYAGKDQRSAEQKEDLAFWTRHIDNAGNLDYVSAWYLCAATWMLKYKNIRAAFVSTNSITQGTQVVPLWETLFKKGICINFAHQTFKWKNEAKDNAAVNCVIIGFSALNDKPKRLYVYDNSQQASMHIVNDINAYLVDADSSVFVRKCDRPLCKNVRIMEKGNEACDGSNLIIEIEDSEYFLNKKEISPYVRKYINAKSLTNNSYRYCLWLENAPESVLTDPKIKERIEKCRARRLVSSNVKAAETPHLFLDRRKYSKNLDHFLVVPRHTTGNRAYIPLVFYGKDTIVSDACYTIENADLYDFGILQSKMHMVWVGVVCGRIKNDFRYLQSICYNPFPWPNATETEKQIIKNLSQNILDIRDYYPEKNLAEIYSIDTMPVALRNAHEQLDKAVDKLYRKEPFENDDERFQYLFECYEKLIKKE